MNEGNFIVCPQCQSQIPEGTACVCGWNEHVHTQETNPVLDIMKRVFGTPAFLAIGILQAAMLVLWVFISFNSQLLKYIRTSLRGAGSNLEINSAFSVNLLAAVLPVLLFIISIYLHYSACKKYGVNNGYIKTTGLTLMRVINFVRVVAIAMLSLLFILGIIMLIGSMAWRTSNLTGASIAIVFLYLLIFVLMIIYYLKYNSALNSIKNSILTGYPNVKISNFLIILMYVISGICLLLAITMMVSFDSLSLLLGLLFVLCAASLIINARIFTKYKREMVSIAQEGYKTYGGAPGYPQQYMNVENSQPMAGQQYTGEAQMPPYPYNQGQYYPQPMQGGPNYGGPINTENAYPQPHIDYPQGYPQQIYPPQYQPYPPQQMHENFSYNEQQQGYPGISPEQYYNYQNGMPIPPQPMQTPHGQVPDGQVPNVPPQPQYADEYGQYVSNSWQNQYQQYPPQPMQGQPGQGAYPNYNPENIQPPLQNPAQPQYEGYENAPDAGDDAQYAEESLNEQEIQNTADQLSDAIDTADNELPQPDTMQQSKGVEAAVENVETQTTQLPKFPHDETIEDLPEK